MLEINYKQIYEVKEGTKLEWVLIIYSISANHYVGTPVYAKDDVDMVYIKSINKYINPNKVRDYNRAHMVRCIYEKRKPLKTSDNDFNKVLKCCKDSFVKYLDKNVNSNDVDELTYLKWCKDKFILNSKEIKISKIKQNSIYWVNLGYNVGSELRKLRPAIMWRHSADNKLWAVIPLTTKRREDEYYFHYDLKTLSEGTARVENMINISYKRIIMPYYSKDKIAKISKDDYESIVEIIKKYYTFEKND